MIIPVDKPYKPKWWQLAHWSDYHFGLLLFVSAVVFFGSIW